jgi:hypothetical protein
MDTNYSFYGAARNKLPLFRNITLRNVHIFNGGKITLDGFDATHRLEMRLDDVTVSGAAKVSAAHGDFNLGPGLVSFLISGDDVHVTGNPAGKGNSDSCSSRFVPMPTTP